MHDFQADCMEDFRIKAKLSQNITQSEFQETFCAWCRNAECPRSHKEDLFTQRVATQWERMCRALQANPNLPKYANVVAPEWADMRQEAMRLEISSRRGDWEVPEDSEVTKALDPVDAHMEHSKGLSIEQLDRQVETQTQELVAAGLIKPRAPKPEAPKKAPFRPALGNTSVPAGGIMLDGSAVPHTATPTPQLVDPWAPPPDPGAVVAPGTVIRFGAGGVIDEG